MGAFLILFSGIFVYYTRMRREWYFVIGLIITGLFMMIVYTYSRSALLGALSGLAVAVIWSIRSLYRKYPRQLIAILIIGLLGI